MRSTGLHAIKSFDLPLIIQGYYTDALSMHVYANMLEEYQRKLLSTDLPLPEATLLATTTKSVFDLQEYPNESCKWECDPKDAKTWADWKLRYKWAYGLR